MGFYRCVPKQTGGGDVDSFYVHAGGQKYLADFGLFADNTSFNSPVTIGSNVAYCSYMFQNCYNFNSPITIGSNVTNCYYMFRNCHNFNQPVNIPDGVTSCSAMFLNCYNFNQPVNISNSAIKCDYMFGNCQKLAKNIYFRGNKVTNVVCLLYRCNNALRKNIFFNSTLNSIFNITSVASVVGSSIIWTTMTNGFYNATYNIYCYNNLAI